LKTPIVWKIIEEETKQQEQVLRLKFDLFKGCYATSLLRELMKTKEINNY
jgi:tRNA(Glu) U13 pseudouridine synthase TruD